MRLSLLFLASASFAALPVAAQAPTAPLPVAQANSPFVKAEAEAVVRELATQLEENFVFPDAAKAYATMLRSNLAAGRYASFASADDFAKAATDDLQRSKRTAICGSIRRVPARLAPPMRGAGRRRP